MSKIVQQFDENIAKAKEAKIELKDNVNPTTEDILKERGGRYGEFVENSRVSQNIKVQFGDRESYEYSTIEALDMIANKIARIVNGDRDYEDNWVDIMGYAQLELEEIRRRTK